MTAGMGIVSTGVAVLHRASGREFGLCTEHTHALDDAEGIVPMGPLFGEFTCVVCHHQAGDAR